jgi:L-alanine-DL-glutamate epimerase-like enolase superfamily enzyme
MKRRAWLGWMGTAGTAGMAGMAMAFASRAKAEPARSGATLGTVVEMQVVRLHLRHTWTTVMSSSEFRDVVRVQISRDGVTGLGEGAPIPRYRETATSALRALQSVRSLVEQSDPMLHVSLLQKIQRRRPGEWAAKAALSGALSDWVGKRLGVPLHRYFGLDADATPVTTLSIGMDTPEMTQKKVQEAADFPVLKIKLGLNHDEETIAAIRKVTQKPLRVDVNEGWKSKEIAARKLDVLAKQGVELVEQPLPAAMLAEAKWLKTRSPVPIFADESCLASSDIPRIADTCHGVNIKLDKCGGVFEARNMIAVARAHGLRVMLGCMVSSSVSIAAAAHLSPLADVADLDGFLLIQNDTHESVGTRRGKLILSDRPGLGLVPR